MQQMRHVGPGDKRWLCIADGCNAISTHTWSRATETGDTLAVMACDGHRIHDDLAGHIHLPTCQAPPECTCGGACAASCPCKQPVDAAFLELIGGEDP